MCLRQNLQRHPANHAWRRTVSQYILNAMGGELFTYSWEPRSSRKNSGSHIDASLSRQPLVKGERLVRYEVNAVITGIAQPCTTNSAAVYRLMFYRKFATEDCALSCAMRTNMHSHALPPSASKTVVVTPKGVLLLAMCDASATREGL
jgi:hypothetical protein